MTQKVRVYRNLNKKCWTVKAKDATGAWKVLRYTNYLDLKDCAFVVKERGRQRVLRDGVKNVHAWIEGEVTTIHWCKVVSKINYDPIQSPHFVRNSDGEHLERADLLLFVYPNVFEVVDREVGNVG